MEVNIFQRGCDLIIQKSIKEGFGLVVSEAFWKSKAVVAGDTGGIPIQFPEQYSNYLVKSEEECAEKSLYLLEHREERENFGKAGKEKIYREFLLPSLIRNELSLIKSLL